MCNVVKMVDDSAACCSQNHLSSSEDNEFISDTEVETTNEEPEVTSILQKLKAPKQSDIAERGKFNTGLLQGRKDLQVDIH